jgi:hypothetical protein
MQNRKNEAYWKAREQSEKKWIAQNLENDRKFNNRLTEYYEKAIDDIYNKIDAEYQKIAEVHNDGIGITGAYRAVNEFDIEKYEREAKELVAKANRLRSQGKKVSYKDFTPEENARMKVYNATMRLNRLEYLKSQVGLTMVDLGMNVSNDMRDKIQDDYMDEVKRQSGILGEDLTKTSLWTSKEVATVVMAQTGSANFSQRVWADTDALKAELDAVISTGIIRGDNPREMAKLLKEHVRTVVTNHRYVTERLARTESARVQFVAQKNSLIEMDYRFCQWHAEPSACKICSDIYRHDTKWGRGVYEVDNVPTVPAHPNCRCGISAYWVDDADNSYKANLKEQTSEERVKIKEEVKPKQTFFNYVNNNVENYFVKTFGKADAGTYIEEINKTLNNAPEDIQIVWQKASGNFKLETSLNGSFYRGADKTVYIRKKNFNVTNDMDYYQRKFDVFYHEFGHYIDDNLSNKTGILSNRLSFGRISSKMDDDIKAYVEANIPKPKAEISEYSPDRKMAYVDAYDGWLRVKKDGTLTKASERMLEKSIEHERKRKAFHEIRMEVIDEDYITQDYGDLSDMLEGSGAGDHPLRIGHGTGYWKTTSRTARTVGLTKEEFTDYRRGTEFFAEATSATINNPGSLELIKKYFPSAYDEYLNIIKEVANREE